MGMVKDFKQRFFVAIFLTLPVLLLSPLVQQILGLEDVLSFPRDGYVLLGLASIVFFYGGWPFLKGLVLEVSSKTPGMMTLIGLAITVAYVYSAAIIFGVPGKTFFWELCTLIDIMLLGHWIEMRSVMGAGRALQELARLMPSDAHLVTEDGSIKDVPIETLSSGDVLLVKPGEKIPADGVVCKGSTSLNESMLTGESLPQPKEEGSEVIGGSVNGEGSITIMVKTTGKGSFINQVIELVKQAQQSKSKTQDLANRAALWLTIVALTSGALTLAFWLLFSNMSAAFAVERMVTVMVITCPHALGLAVPLVVAVSTSIAAANGLLIRNRSAFEAARNVDAIVFDKTGTLTEGKFGVTDVLIFRQNGMTRDQLLYFAASVEAHSEHPIAKGIVHSVEQSGEVENFVAIPGKGAVGHVDGREVHVVSPGYLKEQKIEIDDPHIEQLYSQGKTVIFVLVDNVLEGAIALADIIRLESKEAIRRLQAMGKRCFMLTGDKKEVAAWVAADIGLDEYIAEVLPQEKTAKIKEVQERGLTVAMTGDGVNDAPALAQADVGIAVGAGTDVAVETADIILVKSNPLDIVAIIELARATYAKMIQNLVWATAYNIVAIPIAAGVLYGYGIVLSPAVAAIFMSLSTVICAVNARLLTIRTKES